MSDESESVEDTSTSTAELRDIAAEWFHVPVLAGLAAVMFWLRARTAGRFFRADGVYFNGNDAWYHYRQITYTVHNFPETMPFDPWTYFPYGTSVGQFGTLFDQAIAATALVVGLGDPSARTIAEVTVYAPAVIGTLVILPTYYIGKRFGGRTAGLFAAATLAVIPGVFLQRSLAGSADHNVAEPLFQSVAVLATLVALYAAEREKPVIEQFRDRDWDGLRVPLGWSAVAGVATGLYLWMWPPGVLLVGVLGVFYFLQLTATYLRGGSPDHVAIVGAVSMSVTTGMALAEMTTTAFSASEFSLLQPLAAGSVAVFSAAMALLAREWDGRDLPRSGYAAAVVGTVAVGTLAVWLLLPELYAMVQSQLLRFVGFGTTASQRTITEAQPLLSQTGSLSLAVTVQYGLAFFAALVGAALLLARAGVEDGTDSGRLLVLVWFAFMTAAAFTQARFNYYLAVPVAVLTGYAVYALLSLRWVGVPRSLPDVTATQVLVIGLAILLVLVPPVAGVTNVGDGGTDVQVPPIDDVAERNGPSSPMLGWNDALTWMQENTPAEGTYGGADNAGAVDYYGTVSRTGDFDYPAGYYGVMSWWDYGHWITVMGERIPNANPFQQGASTAANFLLAPSETAATGVLEGTDEDDAETRYVMVDWQMASVMSKFGAPTVFYDDAEISRSDFMRPLYAQVQGGWLTSYTYEQRYYDSMMVRLYRNHGSAQEVQPIVTDWQLLTLGTQSGGQITVRAPPSGNASFIRSFQNMSAARSYVEDDGTAMIGGVAGYPTERVPALEQYRLVRATNRTSQAFFSNEQRLAVGVGSGLQSQLLFGMLQDTTPSTVKAFERVDGATITGSNAPANSEVRVSVEMEMSAVNRTFTYTAFAQADGNGEFSLTVPYSTTGYEEYGVDAGYTNVSVRATGPYTVTAPADPGPNVPTYVANASVTEGQVVGEDDAPTSVTLQERTGGGNGSDGNETATDALDPVLPTGDVDSDPTPPATPSARVV